MIFISYAEKARSCVACGKEFDENDDVVFCPDCGAPHHRECWKQEGHCHYEAAHGTELQWHPKEEPAQESAFETDRRHTDSAKSQSQILYVNGIAMTRCPGCGRFTPCSNEDTVCRSCGSTIPGCEVPVRSPADGFTGAACPPGAEPDAGEPIDDATVGKLSRIVLQRREYYLPRFRQLKNQGPKTVSWNWAAFLLSPYWFAYRKCYLWSAFSACFDLLAVLLTYPMTSQLTQYMAANPAMSYPQLLQSAAANLSFSPAVLLLAQGALLLLLLRSVLFGCLGNFIYKKECLKRVRRLDAMPTDQASYMVFRLGGVNIFTPVVVYYLISIIQSLLVNFI